MMYAGIQTVETMFTAPQRFEVPLYQRPYVWTKEEQLEPLWEDIRRVAERLLAGNEVRAHFLGALVLDQVPNPTGYLQTRLVIDGQQRLMTLQLLLEAFSDVCGDLGVQDFDRALVQLTRNDSPLSKDADAKFKVWPTNLDRELFRGVMDAESATEVLAEIMVNRRSGEVREAIPRAYLYFFGTVRDWLTSGDEGLAKRVEALFGTLYRHVRFVVIDLGPDDDPQTIFETLNARGTPLLPADLIKNFLFHRALTEPDSTEDLYKDYWADFDSNADYWRSEVGRGHAKRARVDLFLQNYLTLELEDDVAVGHLYAGYAKFVKERGPAVPTREHLKRLHSYSKIFHRFEATPGPTADHDFYTRLRAMETVTAYPFLMELLARHASDLDTVLAVLTDLESFLVRRMICQVNTRGYGRLFIDMLRALTAANGEPRERVRRFLLESDAETRRWPDDKDFHAAWMTTEVGRLFVQPRTQLILKALESALHSDKTEKLSFGGKLSIEHVMPRGWKEADWPLPTDVPREEASARRNRLIQTIGNLTLTTAKLNSALSNECRGERKRAEIKKHAVLRLNTELADHQEWNEDLIVQRGERLLGVATRLWPRPASVGV